MEVFSINWKKKLLRVCCWIIFLLFLVGFLPFIFKFFFYRLPVLSNWFQDERPTGNPMRVEKWLDGTRFNQEVDELVFKIQNFEGKPKDEKQETTR